MSVCESGHAITHETLLGRHREKERERGRGGGRGDRSLHKPSTCTRPRSKLDQHEAGVIFRPAAAASSCKLAQTASCCCCCCLPELQQSLQSSLTDYRLSCSWSLPLRLSLLHLYTIGFMREGRVVVQAEVSRS